MRKVLLVPLFLETGNQAQAEGPVPKVSPLVKVGFDSIPAPVPHPAP